MACTPCRVIVVRDRKPRALRLRGTGPLTFEAGGQETERAPALFAKLDVDPRAIAEEVLTSDCILPVDECSCEGNRLGPTLEEFAIKHQLPPPWLELRKACNQFVERADFWYRVDLRDAARRLAVEASDILHLAPKRTDGSAQAGMARRCPQDVNESTTTTYKPFDHRTHRTKIAKKGRGLAGMDEAYMKRAIALAKIALTNGDTPVGSLVVHRRKIIAEGVEAVKKEMDVSAHAELIAIRDACLALRTFDLSGCVLYTTAEPCFMCSYAVRQTRIGRLVIGRGTPKVGGISSNHPVLTDPHILGWGEPPEIISGVLESECVALHS